MVRGGQLTENTCIHFQKYTVSKNQEVGFLDIWSGQGSSPHLCGYSEREKMDFFHFPPFFYDHIQFVRGSSKPHLTILVLGVIDISITSKLQLLHLFSRKMHANAEYLIVSFRHIWTCFPARSAVGVQWAFSAPTVGHCTCTALKPLKPYLSVYILTVYILTDY